MKLKRLLSAIVIAVFVVAIVPLASANLQVYAVEDTGNAKYNDFINQSKWQHGKTTTGDCFTYVSDFTNYCFGRNPTAGTYFTNTSEIRAGDVIWINYSHYFIVLKRSGNRLYTAEGNYVGRNNIGWDFYTITGSAINNQHIEGWHHAAASSTGPSGSPVTIQDTVYSIHSAINNNLVLDVANGKNANGTNIQTQKYHGGPAQRFNVVHRGSYYTIHAQCSNLLIDTENNSSTSGANIFTWSDTGANGQHWEFIDAGGGYYYIRSKNGLYLDVKDGKNAIQTNIIAHSFNGSNAQKWKLVEESKTIEEGYYSIKSAQNNNMVLDIKGQSQVNGGNLQLYSYNGSRAQVFYVKKENSNYIIKPLCSGLLIDTSGNSKTSGTNLQQWSNTGASGQRFKLVIAGDNNYFIRSNLGRFVDVYNGKYVNGTNINSHQFNGSKAQTWKFVKEDISRFRPKMPDVKVTGANGNVTIQWNSVDTEFKNKYDVRIYDMDKGTSNYIKVAWGVEGTSYALSLPKGNYGVTVAAVDKIDNKLFSDAKLVKFKVTDKGMVECDAHSWDSGKVTVSATTSATGVKIYTCTVCKVTKTESIPKLPVNTEKPTATTEQAVKKLKVDKSIPKIAAAKIKTIGSTSKKQMTIEIPKVAGAANYIVAYKTADAKTWKYYYTGGSNRYVIKSLKLNSTIQFRVAAYKNNARGDWSNISYRYMMTAKSSKAKAGKKSITVTWKKDVKATGYQVLYSTNKNMKGYKTITLKGASKTKRVIKGLKKGKTYYVRVRPIKKYKVKNYVGILAPIRSVKVK